MSYIKEFAKQVQLFDTGYTKVRIGNKADGGYILLHEVVAVADELVSFGVGDDVSFELDLVKRYFAIKRVSLFDPTIKELPEKHPLFRFHKRPCDPSMTVPVNALVKMDIEGAEWDALHSMDLEVCSQLVVEFHLVHADAPQPTPYFAQHFSRLLLAENASRFARYARILEGLNRDFLCFHAHVNNSVPVWKVGDRTFPPLLEMSFVRKDLVPKVKRVGALLQGVPGLDFPNKTDRPDQWWCAETCEGGPLC